VQRNSEGPRLIAFPPQLDAQPGWSAPSDDEADVLAEQIRSSRIASRLAACWPTRPTPPLPRNLAVMAADACEGWRVCEVIAHMTMAERYTEEEFMASLRAGSAVWWPGTGPRARRRPGPRSRRPKTSPNAISDDAAGLIVALRKELAGQGLDAGPDTIAWHLERHHQTRVSPATISRYLAARGLVVPQPRKRPKASYIRFAAELPNQCWQADFTQPARRRHRRRDPDLAG
jgi:hypothetical protein